VADTIGKTILGINDVIKNNSFDLVIVFGDVNATAAGAIVAVQSRIPVMHVEAGLRSFDRDMPEEINRIITDHVSDYLMVSEESGIRNLKNEGISDDNMLLVGNIMIECLLNTKKHWEEIELSDEINKLYNNKPVIATFHRPENVDNAANLKRLIDILSAFSKDNPVIFPVHPRTKQQLESNGLYGEIKNNPGILLTEPLSYFAFLKLISNAGLVITDSGGVQEETSFLNVPCITFRKNTERPVTVTHGTNRVVGLEPARVAAAIDEILSGAGGAHKIPELWDGRAAERIIAVFRQASA